MKTAQVLLLMSSLLIPASMYADVTYQETTEITGGSLLSMVKMAGMISSSARQASAPTTSTVMIHGNRMVRINQETTEIIDLDARNITFIDHHKRNYYVITFADMQRAIADAAAKAKENRGAASAPQNGQMEFTAHVSSTGATRQIDSRVAHESLVTLTMLGTDGSGTKAGMAATSELWLVQDVPGMEEMQRFGLRLAQELSIDTMSSPGSSLLASQPGGADALAALKRESAKVKGYPVLQVTRLGMSMDGKPLPAPSVVPAPSSSSSHDPSVAGQVTGEVATDTATQTANNQVSKLGGFGRTLGGSSLGALMRHKPAPAQNSPAPTATDPEASSILIESQSSTSNFSTNPVSVSSFEVPSGYKNIPSPLGSR
jgi:hypothetical protein